MICQPLWWTNKKRSKSKNILETENLINYRNWSSPSNSQQKLNFLLLMITWKELCVNIFFFPFFGEMLASLLDINYPHFLRCQFDLKGLKREILRNQYQRRIRREIATIPIRHREEKLQINLRELTPSWDRLCSRLMQALRCLSSGVMKT